MMTSVSLPSNSGPLHGGYSTVADETTGDSDFESHRPSKRCLPASMAESCKKRRKQSTPVRISAVDSELPNPLTEGKLQVPSPEPELKCPICQFFFDNKDQLESHMRLEHSLIECKKEIEDFPSQNQDRSNTPIELSAQRSELPWMTDLQNKEWLNPNLLPFTTANHMFMSLSQYPQTDTVPPRQPIRIFNPDAYCELCNKEFCNKYFLKTHKANKHGIYTDPPTTDPLTSATVNVPSYATNMKLPNSVPSIDVKSEAKPPPPQVTVINPFSDLFTNPFANKLLTKTTKPITKDQDIDTAIPNGVAESERLVEEPVAEESGSPTTQQGSPSLKNEATEQDIYYTSPSKMSPGQTARELDFSNRLRRIGVMNPKAFCEICCKEYCNKYFLRTHKMKRHGIYVPDDGKEIKVDSFGNILWSQNTQTSPLNLIMAEQSNSNSQNERKTSSPTDICCDLCGIKFQNASLAQLHNVNVHAKMNPIAQDASNGSNDDEKVTGDINEKSNAANDTISEDLQKLQTMILQLNDLDVTNKILCVCNICNKEFENRYFLHTHSMTEHGLLLDDVVDNEKSCEGENINNNTLCDLCGKDFQNIQEMKKHASEYHSNQTNDAKEEFNGFTTPEKSTSRTVNSGQLPERRSSMNLTPTSSYCEICNKELCNKYFMKTHMQRMHGIEIENGAQIGGVICDICNKELCSKYFLRVHKHNTHGIVEYGPSLLQPRKSDEPTVTHLPTEPDNSLKPTDLADLSHRYFTHFTEVCTICSRRFRSTKWLKAHLLSDHGQAGVDKWSELEQQLQVTMNHHKPLTAKNSPQAERISPTLKIPNGGHENNQNMGIQNVLSSIFGDDENNAKTYDCSYCPFTTPILPFLFVHERSHTLQSDNNEHGSLKCPVCGQMFLQSDLLQHHIFSQHPLLPLPPFFNGNAEPQGEASKEPSESTEEVEDAGSCSETSKQGNKGKKVRRKLIRIETATEMGPSLKDVAKRSQLPATYALPQAEETTSSTNATYVMQAFLLEETSGSDRRFMPSLVFLPVLQKLSAPNTITFTLTPA